jgi:membrane dipeptidase
MPKPAEDAALAKAKRLLRRHPLVDGHNDLPWVIRNVAGGDVAAFDLARDHDDADTDIPKLRRGQVSAQLFAAYLPTKTPHPARETLAQIDVARRIVSHHPDVFMLATRASDVERARKAGRIAVFLTVENGVGLENSIAPLRIWHAAGVRVFTLCHNETLDWIDSATDAPRHNGLTDFGRAVVQECNRLGMLIDLAHVAPHAMHHVLDETKAPVVWSHSNATALAKAKRNVPDDVLHRVRANDGVVMATFIPRFLSDAPIAIVRRRSELSSLAAMEADASAPASGIALYCDHVAYLRDRVGEDHIGIGSDFYGGDMPVGLSDAGCFPEIFAELIRRGWKDAQLAKLAGGNVLRVLAKVERIGRRLGAQEAPRLDVLGTGGQAGG